MIYLLLTWLAAPLLWLRTAFARRQQHRRILVIQTAKIGDFVATTPIFGALRQYLPDTEIVALLHPVNFPLAKGLSGIDRIVTLPEGGFGGWSGKYWLYQLMRQDFDAVLILSPNLSTYLVPFWAGIATRVSVLPDRRQGSTRLAWPFVTHGEAHCSGRLFRDTALRALGVFLDRDVALSPLSGRLAGCPEGEQRRQRLLQGRQGPFVGLGLGAGNRMKALSASQLSSLANCIIERTQATIVCVGTVADQAAARELQLALPAAHVVDTTGQFSLAELPSLLAGLDCFVGVDSGATYIADAMGVPVIDFMGPADAEDQRPTGACAVVLQSDEPCAPCSHSFDAPYTCRLGTLACVRGAPLHKMADAVCSILETGAISVPDR